MRNSRLSAKDYCEGVLKGDKMMLGRAISIIESTRLDDREISREILETLIPKSGRSVRIGVTGVPGVGKSTFIENLGSSIIENENLKVAVLAVDPSSQRSSGSILGDKTRMTELSVNSNAFVRPSPTGNVLGGLAANTREVIILCEAAGYEVVLVETVGVGQSEAAVRWLVDYFILLMLTGAGDDLQGIKRGIIEMANLIAVNKADGENESRARDAEKQIRLAIELFPKNESDIETKVLRCSSTEGSGISEIWKEINQYLASTRRSGYFEENRRLQGVLWLHEYIREKLKLRFLQNPEVAARMKQVELDVRAGTLSPVIAANQLLELA